MGRRPPERLGTFTRRIGTLEHFRWLEGIVGMILILNALDAFLTIIWVHSGLATEANPLMERLVTQHPALFIITKFSLVMLGSALLWRHRKRKFSVIAIFMLFMLYYLVLLYHLEFLSFRVRTQAPSRQAADSARSLPRTNP